MDTNFDRESMEQQPENNHKEEKRIDSIPLWLQGITEKNAAAPTESEGESEEDWQIEQDADSSEDTGPVSLELTDQVLPEEADNLSFVEGELDQEDILPDWVVENKPSSDDEGIKSFPGISTTPFDKIKADGGEENTEDVPPDTSGFIEPPTESFGEEESVSVPEEISHNLAEADLPYASLDEPIPSDDEAIADTEEIPDWLQEMIAADEKQKNEGQNPMNSESANETTQPVIITPPDDGITVPDEITPSDRNDDLSELDARVEEEPEPIDDDMAAGIIEPPVEDSPPIRRAVMPTANWSRLTDLPEQATEPEPPAPTTDFESVQETFEIQEEPEVASEVEPESEPSNAWEAEPFAPKSYTDQFKGTGFQPIEFTPAAPAEDEGNSDEEPEYHPRTSPFEAFESPAPVKNFEIHPSDPEPVDDEDEVFPEDGPHDEPNKLPSLLAQAKLILEQGEVNQALPIIRSHIDHAENLDDIKDWLLIANDKIEQNRAEVWEALGDIASQKGDFSAALAAYAKAINYLELARKKNE